MCEMALRTDAVCKCVKWSSRTVVLQNILQLNFGLFSNSVSAIVKGQQQIHGLRGAYMSARFLTSIALPHNWNLV